ncbi:MAG: amidohydrolase family protein, partial [Clostridia bacterium]|nr:amidohydrolase family protein [Clostridia bacterium]
MNFNIPTSDAHIHIFWNMLLAEREKQLAKLMDKFNYDTVTILTIPYNSTRLTKCRDFTENLAAFYLKKKMPGKVYAFFGLNHHYDESKNTPEFYREQAEFYMKAGFDGIKMIEGRPRQRHITGGFNDPKYDLLYKYAEEKQIPMVIHSNAPDCCWTDGKSPAKDLGDHGAIMSWMDYHNEIVEILEKYPKLRLTIAHFAFASQHDKEASELLDRFENVYLDVCPNQFMYMDFGQKPEIWGPFFEKYQDRLIYGTDIGSNTTD